MIFLDMKNYILSLLHAYMLMANPIGVYASIWPPHANQIFRADQIKIRGTGRANENDTRWNEKGSEFCA